jgi:8-hydroxy-5-deazaflavin:NADPH oxidoreductase
MSYAIIGFGKIGHALAKAFARNGIEVSVATTRDPESFAADAAAIGPTIIPATLAEAVKADVIFLAVRFEAHPNVAKALPSWQGKTIIDVTNAYGVPAEKLGGQPSSKFVAQAFTGAKLVKGFNHLLAAVLDQDPAEHGGKRVVFLASDDGGAAAISRGDREALLALVAEDIEWIVPGEDWPLAGTHRGHAGLADLLETASKSIETSTEPREFVAQGDRVLVVGFARGKIKATNKTFEDDWIFAITVRDGRLTSIREYVDTQALARAAQMDASGLA